MVLAYGAIHERSLGLPNEKEAKHVYSSREVVNWYNGSLDSPAYPIPLDHHLSKVTDLVIIGNGNVAIDIGRIFLKNPLEDFSKSDMPTTIINSL